LAYRGFGGRWVGEIEAWAEAAGIDPALVCFGNCSYELAHAVEWAMDQPSMLVDRLRKGLGSILGCTAGVCATSDGLVHVRSLDWPLEHLGRHSLVVRFHEEDREFFAVTMPGFVGVLTGMVPGGYSVSINYAPPSQLPVPHQWGPAFLLREVLETCDTYREAVTMLRDTPLSTPVFFTVCGIKPGLATVIERLRGDARLRRMRDGLLVQANHHVARAFRSNNAIFEQEDEDGASIIEFSRMRHEALARALRRVPKSADIDRAAETLDVDDVLNDDTHQQVAFCPATGEWRAWMV